ncbi:MAG: YbaN family protein [Planctomycetota bacterium]
MLPTVTGWRRWLYLVLAATCFALGAIGAVLPVIPTTPFLLLTSYFLIRTSPMLYRRLVDSRMFGPILRDWYERGGIRFHIKVRAIVTALLAVAITLWLTRFALWPTLGVLIGATLGIVVILRVRTVDHDPVSPDRPPGA